MMQQVREVVKMRMREWDLTLEPLSRKSGVSIPSISKFLNGKGCTTNTLEKIAKSLGVCVTATTRGVPGGKCKVWLNVPEEWVNMEADSLSDKAPKALRKIWEENR